MTHEYVIRMRDYQGFGDFVANDKINLHLRKRWKSMPF